MMPSLLEMQRAVARAVLGGDPTAAGALVLPDGLPSATRLDVHRATFLGGVVGALRLAMPAVERLVGSGFFEAAAREHLHAAPPRGNDLNGYGGGFADFLEDFAPAASLSYLPDVARLEIALDRARQSEDTPPLDLDRLSALDPAEQANLRFELHPSVVLLRLGHAADIIRDAVLAGAEEGLAGRALRVPCRLMVGRGPGAPVVRRCDEDEALLIERLLAGVALGDALDGLDGERPAVLLAELLGAGLVVGMTLAAAPPPSFGDPT